MSEDLQFVLHENNIHEFIYLKSSRTAVDELYGVFRTYLEQDVRPEVFLLLIDARNGVIPPISYLFKVTQEFAKAYKNIPPGHTAVLHPPNLIVSLIENFMNGLNHFITGHNTLKFFNEDQYDEAMAWLLSKANAD